MPNFEQSAKKRQAHFRQSSATVSQQGRSPSDARGQQYGYLLSLGYEQENLYPPLRGEDGAARFFKDRNIPWWQASRSGDCSKGARPTRNMASSQMACVNFLLPLADIPGALAACLRGIDSDVTDIAPISHGGTVSPVEFEWIGLGRPLEEDAAPTRGANVTSIDAFAVAITKDGEPISWSGSIRRNTRQKIRARAGRAGHGDSGMPDATRPALRPSTA